MPIRALIDQIQHADSLLAAMAAERRLRLAVRDSRDQQEVARLLLDHCGEDADSLTQTLLIRSLAWVDGPLAESALVAMLGDHESGLRHHGAWALSRRRPVPVALPGLIRLATEGGFGTMLAQMAIEPWCDDCPAEIFHHLEIELESVEAPSQRARLAETLGLVKIPKSQRLLRQLIDNPQEADSVRAAAARSLDMGRTPGLTKVLLRCLESSCPGLRSAAVEGLGDLSELGDQRARDVLMTIAGSDEEPLAAIALHALGATMEMPRRSGLRIAQIVLQGRVDAHQNSAGAGDSGGLATLIVSLGRALGRRPEVDQILTVARAFGGPGVPSSYAIPRQDIGPAATLHRVPFGPDGDIDVTDMWRHRLAIERSLERLIRRLGHLDGIHLRFADAGTLAAARIAKRRGIPIFFTLAPDPHSAIRAAEHAGTLSRRHFARVDREQHLLFRAEMVEGLARDARRLALFPRPSMARDLRELLDIDIDEEARRFHTVPEGIDPELPERAQRELETEDRHPPVVAELVERIEAFGPARQGLPLLVGLGRLHPIKGFHRLVAAWAGDRRLRESFNLLIVGGDLDRPSDTEGEMLGRIQRILEHHPEASQGLILFGRRSNLDAARLLAVARRGFVPAVAAGGVFVCASDKEEFGLAILEAMAAGLAVVAPDSGGPATYIRDGGNGFLTRTTSIPQLRSAIQRAATSATDETRTDEAQRLVRERFTIDAMAKSLVHLYASSNDGQSLEPAA